MSARGKPIITLRMEPATISALKICARRYGLTVSDLIRRLIDDQLKKEGISRATTPIPGQKDIDDYLIEEAESE